MCVNGTLSSHCVLKKLIFQCYTPDCGMSGLMKRCSIKRLTCSTAMFGSKQESKSGLFAGADISLIEPPKNPILGKLFLQYDEVNH